MGPIARNIRVSDRQKETMLDFMNNHSEFAAGRFTGPQGKEKKMQMWAKLTTLLNSDGTGASKPVDKWIKVCITSFLIIIPCSSFNDRVLYIKLNKVQAILA